MDDRRAGERPARPVAVALGPRGRPAQPHRARSRLPLPGTPVAGGRGCGGYGRPRARRVRHRCRELSAAVAGVGRRGAPRVGRRRRAARPPGPPRRHCPALRPGRPRPARRRGRRRGARGRRGVPRLRCRGPRRAGGRPGRAGPGRLPGGDPRVRPRHGALRAHAEPGRADRDGPARRVHGVPRRAGGAGPAEVRGRRGRLPGVPDRAPGERAPALRHRRPAAHLPVLGVGAAPRPAVRPGRRRLPGPARRGRPGPGRRTGPGRPGRDLRRAGRRHARTGGRRDRGSAPRAGPIRGGRPVARRRGVRRHPRRGHGVPGATQTYTERDPGAARAAVLRCATGAEYFTGLSAAGPARSPALRTPTGRGRCWSAASVTSGAGGRPSRSSRSPSSPRPTRTTPARRRPGRR